VRSSGNGPIARNDPREISIHDFQSEQRSRYPPSILSSSGLNGSAITLYDPVPAKKLTISLEDFPSNFKNILSWKR
jgi:hypothetical protein